MEKIVFDLIDGFDLSNKTLVLAVSGGADSMSMFFLIKKYFENKGLDISRIKIAHYNHKFRAESEDEAEYLKNFFKNYEIFCGENTSDMYDENSLRKLRYDFFGRVCGKFDKPVLCLGHNLDDRIETMFLNTMRGCNVGGFLNMKIWDEKFSEDKKLEIFRPLLRIPKYIIKHFCEEKSIKYFEDKTNYDLSISKRNFVRHEVVSKLVQSSNKDKDGNVKFYQSMSNLFDHLESQDISMVKLVPIEMCKYRNADFAYRIESDLGDIGEIAALFKKLGIYRNISENNLGEFGRILSGSKSGYKYFNGVYLFNSHGKKYAIKGNLYFRQKKLAEKIKISKIGVYNFLDSSINVDDERYIGCDIRFYQNGDVYKSKKLAKWFINEKIPIFRRNFVPIIAEGNQVKAVLNIKDIKGYI